MSKTYYTFPSNIIVGFKSKDDKLAFVTYKKEDGQLAREVSFKNWINKSLPIDEYENLPFRIFKMIYFVGGDSYSHARLAQCEIEDPRGFRCQIKVDNLMDLLQNFDSRKGMLYDADPNGGFVYGWDGQTINIISINDEAYKSSIKKDEAKTLSIKELIPGNYYKDKYEIEYLYLGKILVINWINDKKDQYMSCTKDYHISPKYQQKYILIDKYDKYDMLLSSKIEFFETNKKLSSEELNNRINEFQLHINGDVNGINKKLTSFNKFIYNNDCLIHTFDEVPPENSYNYTWVIKESDIVFYTIGYRLSKDVITPGRKYEIIQKDNGESEIYTIPLDGRMKPNLQWDINNLINEKQLYIWKQECYPEYANKIKVSDGEFEVGFNRF